MDEVMGQEAMPQSAIVAGENGIIIRLAINDDEMSEDEGTLFWELQNTSTVDTFIYISETDQHTTKDRFTLIIGKTLMNLP